MPLIQSPLAFLKKKNFLIFFVIVGIILVSITLAFYNWYLWFVYPDRDKYPVMGIDVSHHQWVIDWMRVKNSGVDFAYLKATEGDDWVDIRLEENYVWAKKTGIPIWVYHFYSLRIQPQDQLDNIIKTLSGKSFDLPIVIDLEFWWNSSVRPDVVAFKKDIWFFLEWVEKYQWTKPILYTTYEFREKYLQNDFSWYPLWIRDIFRYPSIDNWLIWQYKNRWHIEGINGFVDQNVLSWSLERLLLK